MRDYEKLARAREHAALEKELAKRSFAGLKQALRPSSIAKRVGRKATSAASEAGGGIVGAVQAHPGLSTSLLAGTSLVVGSKAIGRFIADGFETKGRSSER